MESYPYQKAIDLCKGLSNKSDQALFVGIPMGVGADSVDVERFIQEVWDDTPITDDNVSEVADTFVGWWWWNKGGR